MKPTFWIGIAALILVTWVVRRSANDLSVTDAKPNVLFILTDDQGWGDLKLHGNRFLETPNLDRLAHSGAQFDHFFVSPLCAPTRASLLMGRYHLRTGTVSVTQGWERMRSEELTLAEVFRQNGYATGCFGKWHNGEHAPEDPNGQGFDEFLGFCAGHWNNYFDTDLQHNDRMVATKGFITDVLTDAALTFMSNHTSQPFFCYVPFNAPHSPHQVPDRYFDKYKARGLTDEEASIYGIDGRSLINLLVNRRDTLPDRLLFTHVAGMNGNQLPTEPGGVRTAQYRLVLQKGQARLYDMFRDPLQTTDLATGQAQLVQRLRVAYERWFRDVAQALSSSRPIPVAARRVLLQAPEARSSGNVHYKQGTGWANDWLVNWQSPAAPIRFGGTL